MLPRRFALVGRGIVHFQIFTAKAPAFWVVAF